MGDNGIEFKVKKAKITTKDKNGNVVVVKDFPDGGTLRVMKEDKPNNWHREKFNRYEDNIAHAQILQDAEKIALKIMELQPKGINFFSSTLRPRPMAIQKGDSDRAKYRKLYKQRLDEEFKSKKEQLIKFKDKKISVYLCFYLRKRKFEGSDVHNYDDIILDALQPYVGDDRNIISVHLDKKQLHDDYPKPDIDFLENTLIVIVETKNEGDLLKAIADTK